MVHFEVKCGAHGRNGGGQISQLHHFFRARRICEPIHTGNSIAQYGLYYDDVLAALYVDVLWPNDVL